MKNMERFIKTMNDINCADCTREEWLRIGMAAKNCGIPCDYWESWSRTDSARYHRGECERLWKGFNGSVGFGSLASIATAHGVEVPKAEAVTEWAYNVAPVPQVKRKTAPVPPFSIKAATMDGFDLFGALFNEGEYIAVKRNNIKEQSPEIITREEAQGADDISNFCPNPVDKFGNVVEYRYFVAESDVVSIPAQYSAVKALSPLAACAVYSGNKSLHTFVRVDAVSKEDFKLRAALAADFFAAEGCTIDASFINNPKQMARAAGFIRDGVPQAVVYAADTENNGLNAYLRGLHSWENAERVAAEHSQEWILKDYLCRGKVSLMIGQPKIGKTFLLFDMALDIASGRTWLDTFEAPKPRKVFYLSYEMDVEDDVKRINDLARNGREEARKNIFIRSFEAGEGTAIDLQSRSFDKELTRATACGAELVIVDTTSWIYPEGCDENSNKDIAQLMRVMNDYARRYNVAILLVHHTAKQGEFTNIRDTIEKGAGAGAFGRFAFSTMVIEKGAASDRRPEFVAEYGESARPLQMATTGKSVKVHTIKANAVFMPTVIKVYERDDSFPKVSNKGAQAEIKNACKAWRKYYNAYPDLCGDALRKAMNAAATEAAGKRKQCKPSDAWRDEMPRLFEEE